MINNSQTAYRLDALAASELSISSAQRLPEMAATARSCATIESSGAVIGQLELLIENLPAGIVLLDGSGHVTHCNPAAEELLGVPLRGMLWRHVIGRAFSPRIDDGHEVSLHDGRRVSIATRALGDQPGQVLLINDVTETRRLQERLNQHERLLTLGETMASLAHQIRTPLSAALLYVTQLGEPAMGGEERKRFANKAQERLLHLERLIKHMLIYARGGSFACNSIELDGLLAEHQQAMECHLSELGGQLRIRALDCKVCLYGNREALLTALQNLANNALQAGARKLELAVTTAANDTCDITLIDDGPGVAQNLQQCIFEPFFSTRERGTGLGLAVVSAIAKAHGGAVWVESRAGGQGSRFTLRLLRSMPCLASDRPVTSPTRQVA